MQHDEKFVRKCIELSEQALEKGDAPFGALIVKDEKIIAEAINNSKTKISNHVEIIVLDAAHKKLGNSDLAGCILCSNCEPCPICVRS